MRLSKLWGNFYFPMNYSFNEKKCRARRLSIRYSIPEKANVSLQWSVEDDSLPDTPSHLKEKDCFNKNYFFSSLIHPGGCLKFFKAKSLKTKSHIFGCFWMLKWVSKYSYSTKLIQPNIYSIIRFIFLLNFYFYWIYIRYKTTLINYTLIE